MTTLLPVPITSLGTVTALSDTDQVIITQVASGTYIERRGTLAQLRTQILLDAASTIGLGIVSADITSSGSLSFLMSTGTTAAVSGQVVGPQGDPGATVNSGSVDTSGTLHLGLSTGTTIAVLGTVTGTQGPPGVSVNSAAISTSGSLSLGLTNGSSIAVTGNLGLAAPVQSVAGRTGTITLTPADVPGVEYQSNKGIAGGYASLNSAGVVPTVQIGGAVAGALDFQGAWNAASNSPSLVSGVGTRGNFYLVQTPGTTSVDGTATWSPQDLIAFDGTHWDRYPGMTYAVASVAGRIGAVTLNAADIGGLGTLATATPGAGLILNSGTVSASVVSVAGYTGAVTLGVSDISGLGPLATAVAGAGIIVSGGTVSATGGSLAYGAGFTVNSGTVSASVISVAGQTGTVTLAAGDISGLGPLATAAVGAGLAVSGGTLSAVGSFATLTPGAGLAVSGGTLSASVISVAGQTGTVTDLSDGNVIATGGTTALSLGTIAALAVSASNNIGRNCVTNPSMEVAQRGLPVTTSGVYGVDQWIASWSAGTGSVSQGSATGYTSRRQLSGVFTGLTVGATAKYTHYIEAARSYHLAGILVTLQFNTAYTVSAGTASFAVQPYYANSANSFSAVTAIGSPIAFTPTGTPGTYEVSFTVPSAATNGLGFDLVATKVGSTGTLTWSVTSLQIEEGPASTFERQKPDQCFATCQLFFLKSYSRSVPPGTPFSVNAATNLSGSYQAGAIWDDVKFPVTMRDIPTVTFYDGAGSAGCVTYYSGGTEWSVGGAAALKAVSDSGFSYEVIAEIAAFEFTASAELH